MLFLGLQSGWVCLLRAYYWREFCFQNGSRLTIKTTLLDAFNETASNSHGIFSSEGCLRLRFGGVSTERDYLYSVVNGKITPSTEFSIQYLITSVPTTLCCTAKYELSQLNHSRNKTFFLSIEFINFLHQIAHNHTVPEQSPITCAAQVFFNQVIHFL